MPITVQSTVMMISPTLVCSCSIDLKFRFLLLQVDAGFTGMTGEELPNTITRLTDVPYNCFLPNGGASIMTRMDNDLASWWNPALDGLLQSATYKRICQDLSDPDGMTYTMIYTSRFFMIPTQYSNAPDLMQKYAHSRLAV